MIRKKQKRAPPKKKQKKRNLWWKGGVGFSYLKVNLHFGLYDCIYFCLFFFCTIRTFNLDPTHNVNQFFSWGQALIVFCLQKLDSTFDIFLIAFFKKLDIFDIFSWLGWGMKNSENLSLLALSTCFNFFLKKKNNTQAWIIENFTL